MKKPTTPGRSLSLLIWLLLLVTITAKFVPFAPRMPFRDLDSSWQYAMNQAVSDNLTIGKEIILTFGPYASVYSRQYHPATDTAMLAGSFYLALSLWFGLFILMRGMKWFWGLVPVFILAGLRLSPDALFFAFPLIAGIVVFKITNNEHGAELTRGRLVLLFLFLFAPLGFLPLVKGSLLLLCLAMALLCTAFLAIRRAWYEAAMCLAVPMASMVFFWLISGQQMGSLPSYFSTMTLISSHYSEAMATTGAALEIVSWIIPAALLLAAILLAGKIPRGSSIFLLLVFSLVLFLSFKAGFVRHDAHATVSGSAILIAGLLLTIVVRNRLTPAVILLSFISWLYIDTSHAAKNQGSVTRNLRSTYVRAWTGLSKRIGGDIDLPAAFSRANQTIRKEDRFPLLPGTTDIYSFNQAGLFASGNNWSPRPVFQSYAVFSPELAEMNRRHLTGKNSPDNLIFGIEPVDNRFPSLEDGLSWPVLLANYKPVKMTDDYLLLRKNDLIGPFHEDVMNAPPQTHRLGEKVLLPSSGDPLSARIIINPTLAGKLAGFLFKPNQLEITLGMKNGVKKKYRLVACMAESGILITPLVENGREFAILYGPGVLLDHKVVKYFIISEKGSDTFRHWKDEYTVAYSPVNIPEHTDFQSIGGLFDSITEALPPRYPLEIPEYQARGSIDIINGIYPAPEVTVASGCLSVEGWLAADSGGTLAQADAVYLSLTSQDGMRSFISTRPKSRADVAEKFSTPGLSKSGFTATTDISGLYGDYTLGIAMRFKGRLYTCRGFKKVVSISKIP